MFQNRRVVITGLGVFSASGRNVKDFWHSVSNGKANFSSKINGVPYLKDDPDRIGSMLFDYNPDEYFSFRDLKRLDYFAQFGILAADEAVRDAEIDFEKVDRKRIGAIWGSGLGGGHIFETSARDYYCENKPISPFFVPALISDILPGHLSIKYKLMGPTFCTISACSSSSNAIIDSFLLIKNGLSDIIISGGTEARSEICTKGFVSLRALSNIEDNTASRPFDQSRCGFVLGEGAGSLILEDYEHAKARDAKIYAEIIGIGLSSDSYHLTAPHPEGHGCALAMQNAIEYAGIESQDIDYINAHATATVLGDIAEVNATKLVMGEHIYKVSISSTKSTTGHLLGAASAIESISCIMSMKNDLIPPTINLNNIDEKIDQNIDFTPNKAKRKKVNISMNNNFGFGGHNCSVIFKKI